MPTSVHIPKPLLAAVDRKARKLAISRNRLIIRALEKDLADETAWSPGFFDRLTATDPELAAAVDDLLGDVVAHRASKAPRRL